MTHHILLTGATGYVGGRLLRILKEQGHHVRCLARKPEYLDGRVPPGTEIVKGDVLEYSTLCNAMEEIDAAFYMVHSMGSTDDFEELDRKAATNFGRASKECGVKRIVYLGGLGDDSADLSPHLRSRQLVGQLLASAGVPVIEFRASIVIGSGSLSFELIRALTERLPVMITPRWVGVKAQPIAISDVLEYLRLALDVPAEGHTVFEIGGPDRVTYGDLMKEYAGQRGLRRVMIPVPVLTPRLSGLWLGLVTPLYARIGRKLVDSISHPTVVEDSTALTYFPLKPKGVREAIADALRNEERDFVETSWWDSISSAGKHASWGGVRFGNRLVDQRRITVDVSPAAAFAPIQRIGGTRGWYYANWLWRIRGFMDLLVGGVGLRRGRRDPVELRVGDVIDWWRVEKLQPSQSLLLRAEMKLPGRAWLEFRVEPEGINSAIVQTALFDPVGLAGLLYWYGIYPVHAIVFRGMLRHLAKAARTGSR